MRQDARALLGAAWPGRSGVPRRCDAREMTCSPRGTARRAVLAGERALLGAEASRPAESCLQEGTTANASLWWDLTFDMSGDRKPAQPAGGHPLDGGVRFRRTHTANDCTHRFLLPSHVWPAKPAAASMASTSSSCRTTASNDWRHAWLPIS